MRALSDLLGPVFRALALSAVLSAVAATGHPAPLHAADLEGLAWVTDTGNLVVSGREVALFGIQVPTFDRVCRRAISPVRCAPSSVLVLDGLVRGFMHCDIIRASKGAQAGGVPETRCTIAGRRLFDERIDLAAEILSRGWAFVADDAPALYRSLERLARHRGVGMWCGDLTDPP